VEYRSNERYSVYVFLNQPLGGAVPGPRGHALGVLLRTGTPLTGRQIHRLTGGGVSLTSIQGALRDLVRLGMVTAEQYGRAFVYTVNEGHAFTAPLRQLAEPLVALKELVAEMVGNEVDAVLLFGSWARGEAGEDSDVDLAVLSPADWQGGQRLQCRVTEFLGNRCDVLTMTSGRFRELLDQGEPVAKDIASDGIVLHGTRPRVQRVAA
jgi:predicted nucleotidyltransferase